MSRGRAWLKRILYNTAVFFVLYGIMLLPAAMVSQGSTAYALGLMGFLGLAYLFMVLRVYVKNAALLLTHLPAVAAVALLSPGVAPKIVNGLLALFLACFSLYRRATWNRQCLDAFFAAMSAGMLAALSLMADAMHLGLPPFLYPLAAGVVLLAKLWYTQLDTVDRSLEIVAKISTQPIREMERSSGRAGLIVVFLAAAMAAGLCLFGHIGMLLGRLWQGFVTLLGILLRWVFSLLGWTDGAEQTQAGSSPLYDNLRQPSATYNPLWTILGYVITAVFLTLLGVLLYRLLSRFLALLQSGGREVAGH